MSKATRFFRWIPRQLSNFKVSRPFNRASPTTTTTTHNTLSRTLSNNRGRKYNARDTRLFDVDKLMTDIEVPAKDRAWFEKVNVAVREYMYGTQYDASHDYEHIQRVVKEAHKLWIAEKHHIRNIQDMNPLVLFVAAMVHDIGDGKYLAEKGFKTTNEFKRELQRDFVLEFLKQLDCPPAVSGPAAHIASLVSFTREKDDPARISKECEAYPLLKIVQDADRLDALGAMGIARCCVYGGVFEPRRNNTILTIVKLIDDRFIHYPRLMKTETGRREAEKRMKYVRQFKEEMLTQSDCSSILESLEG